MFGPASPGSSIHATLAICTKHARNKSSCTCRRACCSKGESSDERRHLLGFALPTSLCRLRSHTIVAQTRCKVLDVGQMVIQARQNPHLSKGVRKWQLRSNLPPTPFGLSPQCSLDSPSWLCPATRSSRCPVIKIKG